MIFVALLLWFALSIPATLILGRVIAAASHGSHEPAPARRHAMTERALSR